MNFRLRFLDALKRKLTGNQLVTELVGDKVFVKYDKLEVSIDELSMAVALYQGNEKIIESGRVAFPPVPSGQNYTVQLDGLEGRVLLLDDQSP